MARCGHAGCSSPRAGSSSSMAATSRGLSRAEMRPYRRRDDDGLPGPVRLAEPAPSASASSSPRRSRCTSSAPTRRSSAASRSCSRVVGPETRSTTNRFPRTSSRAAQRQRIGRGAGARREPEADRVRRARVPRSTSPCRRRSSTCSRTSSADFRPHLHLHRGTTSNVVRHISDRVMVHVPRQPSVRLATRDQLYSEPEAPVHGRACCPPSPIPKPGARARGAASRSSSRATSRARSTRPSALPLPPALPAPSTRAHCDVETPPLYPFRRRSRRVVPLPA